MTRTPAERLAWREHFKKYPHGDFYTQKLLADIASGLFSYLSGKPVTAKELAPWLYLEDNKDKEVKIEPPTPDEDLILKSLQAIVDTKHA